MLRVVGAFAEPGVEEAEVARGSIIHMLPDLETAERNFELARRGEMSIDPYVTIQIASALDGRAAQDTRHSDTLNRDLLATAVPVVRGSDVLGAVRITQDVGAVTRATRRSTIGLIAIGLMGGVARAKGLTLSGEVATDVPTSLWGDANRLRQQLLTTLDAGADLRAARG